MKKLTLIETNAIMWLEANGPYCPGDSVNTPAGREVKATLDSLVRKRRAMVEATDDGPSYSALEMAHG